METTIFFNFMMIERAKSLNDPMMEEIQLCESVSRLLLCFCSVEL